MKYCILILLIFLISCQQDDKTPPTDDDNDDDNNTTDTNFTPPEKFSYLLLTDFLNDSDDEELAGYLESEIYRLGANYKGASIVEAAPSVWFITLEKDTLSKNYLLQKFIEFKTNNYYFTLKETPLTITDIIARRNRKPAD